MSVSEGAVTAAQAAFSAASAAQAATVALAAENASLQGVIVEQAGVITEQAARIAELEAIVTPPPVGRQAPLLIGAAVAARNGQGAGPYTATWESELGVTLDIARRYLDSVPNDISNTWPVAADVAAGRHLWLSLKGSANAATIAASLRTIPHRPNRIMMVALHHEPDNDQKQGQADHTPAWFAGRLAALGTAVDAVRAEGRTDIIKSFILTGYLEHDDNTNTTSADWFPADPTGWVYGVDPYDPNANATLVAKYAANVAVWRQHGGRMWAVAETGTKLTGAAMAAHITAAIDYCNADPDCVAFCYFHSPIGDRGPWWLDDLAGRAAFADAIRDNRTDWSSHAFMN